MNPFILVNALGPWKWAVYGGLAVALLGGLLWWRSSLINQGRQEGRVEVLADFNVDSAAELKAKFEDIASKEAERQAEAAEVAQMRESLTAEHEALEAQRAELARTSQRAMAEFTRRLKAIAPDVAAVPDERLDAEIAATLAEHRRLDGAQ